MRNTHPLAWFDTVTAFRTDETVVSIYDIGRYVGEAAIPVPEDVVRELMPSDLERADRFVQSADRVRSLLSRYFLRTNLAAQIGCCAQDLTFGYECHGKPYGVLAGKSVPHFNVSHAGRHIAIAISPSVVGIDIERIEHSDNLEDIVRHHFAAVEYEWFQRLPEAVRTRAFYDLWTCKEALVKAMGCGLTEALDALVLLPGTDGIGDWAVRSVPAPEGYAAALAWQSAAEA